MIFWLPGTPESGKTPVSWAHTWCGTMLSSVRGLRHCILAVTQWLGRCYVDFLAEKTEALQE